MVYLAYVSVIREMPIGVLEHVGCVCVPLFLSNESSVALGAVGKEVQRDHSIHLGVVVESEKELGIFDNGVGLEIVKQWIDPSP